MHRLLRCTLPYSATIEIYSIPHWLGATASRQAQMPRAEDRNLYSNHVTHNRRSAPNSLLPIHIYSYCNLLPKPVILQISPVPSRHLVHGTVTTTTRDIVHNTKQHMLLNWNGWFTMAKLSRINGAMVHPLACCSHNPSAKAGIRGKITNKRANSERCQ